MDRLLDFDPGARIGIIGAGASGLSAAHFLGEAGYSNVTILEKERRVGGKCCSIEMDNHVYEMGAVFGTLDYRVTLDLMKTVGMKGGPCPDSACYDEQGRQIDLYAWRQFPQLFWLLKVNYDLLTRLRYRRVHKPGMDHVHPDLHAPFENFARRYRLPALSRVMMPPFTAFGYGYFSEVPAAYVLKYLDPPMLDALRNPGKRLAWPEGIESLWTRLAGRHKVRLGAGVRRVLRQDTVVVETEREAMEFDALILTCPLDDALAFLDATLLERKLFAQIRHYDYWVLLCEIDGLPPGSGYIPAHFVPEQRGHVMLWYQRWPETQLITLYVLGDFTMGQEAIEHTCAADLARMGATLKRVLLVRRWKYFPHVSSADIAAGFYETLESLQGANRTYYAGEVMSFSTVEICARYAQALVERFFKPRPAGTSAVRRDLFPEHG